MPDFKRKLLSENDFINEDIWNRVLGFLDDISLLVIDEISRNNAQKLGIFGVGIYNCYAYKGFITNKQIKK